MHQPLRPSTSLSFSLFSSSPLFRSSFPLSFPPLPSSFPLSFPPLPSPLLPSPPHFVCPFFCPVMASASEHEKIFELQMHVGGCYDNFDTKFTSVISEDSRQKHRSFLKIYCRFQNIKRDSLLYYLLQLFNVQDLTVVCCINHV
jgi:hypothetical protein